MKCPICSATVSDGAAFCSSCGASLASGSEGLSPSEVTPEWLRGVLGRAGYEATLSSQSENAVVAKHPQRPNVTLTIRRDLGAITCATWWSGKKTGWGQEKNLMAALNRANSKSWFDTFCVDGDGDIMISAYITLDTRISESDVLGFLEREALSQMALLSSELKEFVR
jgi:hypothetical protein